MTEKPRFKSRKEAFEIARTADRDSQEFYYALMYCIANSGPEVREYFFKNFEESLQLEPVCHDEDGNPFYEASDACEKLGMTDEEVRESIKVTVNGVRLYRMDLTPYL